MKIKQEITEYSYVIPTDFEDWYNFVVSVNNMNLKEKDHWAIMNNGSVWNKKIRGFVHQSLPSNRNEKFFAETRFTLKEAKKAVMEAIEKVKETMLSKK